MPGKAGPLKLLRWSSLSLGAVLLAWWLVSLFLACEWAVTDRYTLAARSGVFEVEHNTGPAAVAESLRPRSLRFKEVEHPFSSVELWFAHRNGVMGDSYIIPIWAPAIVCGVAGLLARRGKGK